MRTHCKGGARDMTSTREWATQARLGDYLITYIGVSSDMSEDASMYSQFELAEIKEILEKRGLRLDMDDVGFRCMELDPGPAPFNAGDRVLLTVLSSIAENTYDARIMSVVRRDTADGWDFTFTHQVGEELHNDGLVVWDKTPTYGIQSYVVVEQAEEHT